MTIHALTLTNPGAESGSTTGWTVASGAGFSAVASFAGFSPHSGSFLFKASNSSGADWYQQVDVSAYATAIDGNTAAVKASGWQGVQGGSANTGLLYVECYASDGTTLLFSDASSAANPSAWAQVSLIDVLPVGTRFVRIGTVNTADPSGGHNVWDDFALELGDAATTDYPVDLRASQVVTYALVSEPAAQLRASQIPVLAMTAAEETSGLFLIKTHQVVAYALVKGKVDRMDLRAWPLLQDDHLFYGLQLGNGGTIIFDILTQKWAQWLSPGFAYFRVEDCVDWEGFNIGCDTEDGTLWKVDPTGRLDGGDTVITSQVTGQATVRGRRAIPNYTAELACSQAEPAAETGTSIQLRVSDDGTQSWLDHGSVTGEAAGTSTLFRWYGLGLMQAPGRVFEITNIGYARRLDGFDLEVGGSAADVSGR